MITNKQRNYLRKLAQDINPLVQVGKSGLNDAVYNQIDEILEARELMKVKFLQNSMLKVKDLAAEIAQKTKSDIVLVIGSIIILYRESSDIKKRKIKLPN